MYVFSTYTILRLFFLPKVPGSRVCLQIHNIVYSLDIIRWVCASFFNSVSANTHKREIFKASKVLMTWFSSNNLLSIVFFSLLFVCLAHFISSKNCIMYLHCLRERAHTKLALHSKICDFLLYNSWLFRLFQANKNHISGFMMLLAVECVGRYMCNQHEWGIKYDAKLAKQIPFLSRLVNLLFMNCWMKQIRCAPLKQSSSKFMCMDSV